MEFLIFKEIEREPQYGGKLVELARSRLSEDIKIPTVYAILNRSKENGLLDVTEGEKQDVTRGTARRYYSLTEEGTNYVIEMQEVISSHFTLVQELIYDTEVAPA